MLSSLVITFLPRSKRLLISWLQSLSIVILEPKKIKSATVFAFPPSICHEVMGPDAMTFVFQMSFKPAFLLFSFTFIKRLFSSSSCSAIRVVSSAYLRLLIFFLTILNPACASSSLAFYMMYSAYRGFPGGSDGKESACSTGDLGSIPESERSLAEGMAIHSIILTCRIPWTERPGELQFMWSQRIGHD